MYAASRIANPIDLTEHNICQNKRRCRSLTQVCRYPGRSRDKICDLVGNLAEYVSSDKTYPVAFGGSFADPKSTMRNYVTKNYPIEDGSLKLVGIRLATSVADHKGYEEFLRLSSEAP